MNHTQVSHEDGVMPLSWPWWRRAITGLSLVALTLSGYLGWHYMTGAAVIGCNGGSACDEVLTSRWSSIGGVVPISGLAIGSYLAMLIASLNIGPTIDVSLRRISWGVMLILAGAIAGSAVWFIVVQKWFIGSFCPYCMATHVTGLLLATLIFWRASKPLVGADSERVAIGIGPATGMSFVGFVFAGILAGCQIYFKPPTVYRGGEAQITLPDIDPHNAPLAGSPGAAYVVTLLYDYNCPHCQKVHAMLEEVIRRYHGKLAFLLCPTPLNPRCNPYVPQGVKEFQNSCELAKISLAVWVAKREVFPNFERWMFSFESGDQWHPRTVDAATAKAIDLVGESEFKSALANSWIEQYLEKSIRVYSATALGGNNAVPKFVYGAHWVIPQPHDVDDLIATLNKTLAVRLDD